MDNNLDKQFELAIKFYLEKKYLESARIYNRLENLNYNTYDFYRFYGVLKIDLKEYREADRLLNKAIIIRETGYEVYSNLGQLHILQNKFKEGLDYLNKSLEIKSDYTPAINNMSWLFNKCQSFEKSLIFARRSLNLKKTQISLQNYAIGLFYTNSTDKAIKILEDLCPLQDKTLNASNSLLTLIKFYIMMGKIEKAETIIKKLFTHNSKNNEVFELYAEVKNITISDEILSYFKNLLKNFNKNEDKNEDNISKALFSYYHNKKCYEEADMYLKTMNKNMIKYYGNFNIDNFKIFVSCLINYFKNCKITQLDTELSEIKPIFICGMPRSGTSLCEQILDSHKNVLGLGELDYLHKLIGINYSYPQISSLISVLKNKDKLIKIREKYLYKLKNASENETFICDKLPQNFIIIGIIKILFPEAKIVYCRRNIMDNCFSLYKTKFVNNNHLYSYNKKTLFEYYRLHETLIDFWFKKYPGIFLLDNNQLISDKNLTIRKLLKYCGLPFNNNCLSFMNSGRVVFTASTKQIRKDINKESLSVYKNYDFDI